MALNLTGTFPILTSTNLVSETPEYTTVMSQRLNTARDVAAYIVAANATRYGTEPIVLARMGNLVFFQTSLSINIGSGARELMRITAANGFRPVGTQAVMPPAYGATMTAMIVRSGSDIALTGYSTTTSVGVSRWIATWWTTDSWPTNPPGNPM